MCRNTLSVEWDGHLYDCDFNQMLGLTVECTSSNHINNFDFERLRNRKIVIGNHCFPVLQVQVHPARGHLKNSLQVEIPLLGTW